MAGEGVLADAVVGLRAPRPAVLVVTHADALVAVAREERVGPADLRAVDLPLLVQRHLIVPAARSEADAIEDDRRDDAPLVCKHHTIAVEAARVGAVLALEGRKRRPRFKHLELLATHTRPRAHRQQRRLIARRRLRADIVEGHPTGGLAREWALTHVDEQLGAPVDCDDWHEATRWEHTSDGGAVRVREDIIHRGDDSLLAHRHAVDAAEGAVSECDLPELEVARARDRVAHLARYAACAHRLAAAPE